MYTRTITAGKDYSDLKKCIAILITDYDLPSLVGIEKYISKWNLREEDYVNFILTDDIQIYIMELLKFEKYKKGQALDNWVKFILNPKVINMSNKEIKKAKELLEEISKNDQERYLAELREKYIRDQKATEGAGYDKGLAAGLKQGEKNKAIEIAKKLKQKGIDIEIIKETTNLTIEEINKI